MLRSLFAWFGLGRRARPPYRAYPEQYKSELYNLLFCDDRAAFAPKTGTPPAPWQTALGATIPDAGALLALAGDANLDGRIRYMAGRRLAALRRALAPKQLFGVIVELPTIDGIDTLAAYRGGHVRFLHRTAPGVFVGEGVAALQPGVERLFEAAQPILALAGPREAPRRPPPPPGNVRLTFLVSDGLTYAEGPLAALDRDPFAALVVQRATQLLHQVGVVTKAATRST